jgi:hypothetical protein
MTNRNHRRSGRFTAPGSRPPTRPSQSQKSELPLVQDAQRAVSQASPFDLLALASQLIEVTTLRPAQRWHQAQGHAQAGPPAQSGTELFDSFVFCAIPAMSALALAIGTMHHDRHLGDRLIQSIDPSLLTGLRPWVQRLADINITDFSVQSHVLGDGDNFVISWSWPGGEVGSMVVYIDHNMGTAIKDAFPLPENQATLLRSFDQINPSGEITTTSISAADAKACIKQGLARGEITVPPFESDTWPMCRPWLEWLLRELPDGGQGFAHQDWDDDAQAELMRRFMKSKFCPPASQLSASEVRDLVGPLLFFGMSSGNGDPLRWSPVTIEIVLTDWYVRKVFGVDPALLLSLPRVLKSFVEFAHHERNIPASLTKDTLDAIVRWQLDFRNSVDELTPKRQRGPRRNESDDQPTMPGIMRMTDGIAHTDRIDDPFADLLLSNRDEASDDNFIRSAADSLERGLLAMVGGQHAYDNLTADPLPDVAFNWTGVTDAVRPSGKATLTALDEWASTLFDDEVRTIARSVLRAVLIYDPSVFKRSPKPESLAAAILGYLLQRVTAGMPKAERNALWSVATVKALAEATDVSASSIGSRSATIKNVIEASDLDWTAFLHSCQRRDVLRSKALIAGWRSRS